MIDRILRSVSHRSSNRVYFAENQDKIGISQSDFMYLKKQGQGPAGERKIKLFGKEIQYPSPYWLLHSLDEIYVEEVYKFKPRTTTPLIVDVGANIGLSVIYFKRCYPGSKLIAFEPDPLIFRMLKNNITSFDLQDVTLYNNAAWINESELSFAADGKLGGRLNNAADNSDTIKVKSLRLREFLGQRIDFLKIDIEGAEYEVIKDCHDLFPNIDKLFIEYHVKPSETQYLDEILQWVRKAGFRYYIREAWDNKRYPFLEENSNVFEMQLNIFCYR